MTSKCNVRLWIGSFAMKGICRDNWQKFNRALVKLGMSKY